MNIEIVKFDNNGRGIGYVDGKIIFVPKTVPGDIVNVKVTIEKKNYLEGKLTNIIKPSKMRSKTPCPLFEKCGGCDLMNISISNMLEYKLAKVNDILKCNKIDYDVKKIVKSEKQYNYRNKVTLKIIDGKIGYFENDSHSLVEIDNCLLCSKTINEILSDLKLFEILNGEITIRVNYKNELLLSINTKEKVKNIEKLADKYLITGIVLNDKVVYGQDYFIDKVNDYLFKVSYNSFFQINPYICSELIKILKKETGESQNILDLYCGVGVLGISCAQNSKSITGIEINENSIRDALINKSLNNINNATFICSDTKKVLEKITGDFECIIFDPPRSGVDKNVLQKVIDEKIKRIVYISCNPITLVRDLTYLHQFYDIADITLLDMFPNTEHCESVCLLERR